MAVQREAGRSSSQNRRERSHRARAVLPRSKSRRARLRDAVRVRCPPMDEPSSARALLHGPSFLWDAGAQMIQTIFDGGKLIGQDDLAYATQKALVAAYEYAILNAYADVETALGQVRNAEQEEARLRDEVAAARKAFQIGALQYREGTAGLLTVLQTQQTLFAARNQLVQARLARMQAVVHLYVALGGGWKEPPLDRTQFIATPARPISAPEAPAGAAPSRSPVAQLQSRK